MRNGNRAVLNSYLSHLAGLILLVAAPDAISLITEAPDESMYGEDIRIAHEAHYRVIIAVAGVVKGQAGAGAV